MKMLNFRGSHFSDGSNFEEQQQRCELARSIGPVIERQAREIFREYKEVLLAEPATYIIPAIWGIEKHGELSRVQKEIHRKVAPTLKEIVDALSMTDQGASHRHAISFLVRNLIVSKILFAMECFKNQLILKKILREDELAALEDPEVLGVLH